MASKFGSAVEIEAPMSKFGAAKLVDDQPQQDQGFIDASQETLGVLAKSFGAELAGGIGGILSLIQEQDPNLAANVVKTIRDDLAAKDISARSQGQIQDIGGAVETVADVINVPISGVAATGELLAGQGLNQAVDTIRSVKDVGLSKTMGERAFEETGSPLAATVAEVIPQAITDFGGLAAGKTALNVAKNQGDAVSSAIVNQLDTMPRRQPFTTKGKGKQRIAELINQGSADVSTARYSLPSPSGKKGVFAKLSEKINIGSPDIVKDPFAVEAIKQNFDEGIIAAIKASSGEDKQKMLKMSEIMQRGKKNKLISVKERPADVVGDSLMDRVRVIQGANRSAGKELEAVAKNLKGESVDFSSAVNSFMDDLDDMGISLGDDFKPDFSGSDIEGVTAAENAINKIMARMNGKSSPDAYDVHRMKKFIDEQVTFGKNAEGLAGKSEAILKKLRRNLDGVLDNNFPEYDRINTAYAETIGALDALQDVAGRKMDLTGPNADKATGTLMRRVMSNAQSRVNLVDALDQIEGVANKYISFGAPRSIDGKLLLSDMGAKSKKGFTDDLLMQVLFADELDAVFKPVARTSLQGDMEKVINRGAAAASSSGGSVIVEGAGKAAEKLRGINQENAFKSINELLKTGN